jgi:hypothetical protein
MEFVKLLLGVGLIMVFTWFALKNIKRVKTSKSLFNFVLSFDIIAGIVAGFYLVITSIQSLFL